MDSDKIFLSGIFTTQELETLQKTDHRQKCNNCQQKLQCAKLSCGDILCTECLDSIVDENINICPLCSKQLGDFQYILKT